MIYFFSKFIFSFNIAKMARTSILVSDLVNATKLGQVVKKVSSKGFATWDIAWEKEVGPLIKQENGRIYFIIVDGAIKKIGCSECKGGMKTTFAFYKGGLGGSPSLRTFGIHHLIFDELKAEKKVELYGMWNNPIKVEVKGLFGEEEQEIYPAIRSMEEKCRLEYKEVYGKYPDWNFQENAEQWPTHIQELYKIQVQQRGVKFQKMEAEKEDKFVTDVDEYILATEVF